MKGREESDPNGIGLQYIHHLHHSFEIDVIEFQNSLKLKAVKNITSKLPEHFNQFWLDKTFFKDLVDNLGQTSVKKKTDKKTRAIETHPVAAWTQNSSII